MRLFSTCLFFLILSTVYGQSYIDGPANMRDQPNGNVVISLNNNVLIDVYENINDWRKIVVQALVKDDAILDNKVQKGSFLYNEELEIIGKTILPFTSLEAFRDNKIDGYQQVNIMLYTYKDNIKDLSIDEILKEKNVLIDDNETASLVVFKENGIEYIQKHEINYSYDLFFDGKDLKRYLIKTENFTKQCLDAEKGDTEIKLSFYPNFSKEKAFSYTKKTDLFYLDDEFLVSTQYGCCGAEDYTEFSSFPDNKTFLKFNRDYYLIEVPNTQNRVVFGFNVEERYAHPDELLLGVLNYSFNYHQSGSVKFYAANKDDFEHIAEFVPDIKLYSEHEKDHIRERGNLKEMVAWTFDQNKNLNALNGIGVKITFINEANGKRSTYPVLIENGKITSDKIMVKFD